MRSPEPLWGGPLMPRGWSGRLALAAAGAGVLLLCAGGGLALNAGAVDRTAGLTLVFGAAALAVGGVLDPGAFRALAQTRRGRFATLAVLVSTLTIGILGLLNLVAARSVQAIDLTRAGYYTLAPQSVLAAKRLDSDLTITGFFRPDQQASKRTATGLIQLYQQQTPHIQLRFADPDQDPALAQQLGVDIAGDLVLRYKAKPPVILTLASQSEADVTGALLRLQSNRSPLVCWAQGDGERDLLDRQSQTGYAQAQDVLKQRGYRLQTLLLSQQTTVPADCEVVAVVGPTSGLTAPAQAALNQYLGQGGKLLLAYAPWQGEAVTASLNAPLKDLGVGFSGGLVVEGDSSRQAANDRTVAAVFKYGDSPISKGLAGHTVLFPHSSSVSGQSAAGVDAVDVAQSSSSSYLVAQPRAPADLDRKDSDQTGPLTLMKTLEVKRTADRKTRVVLVGTPDIAENLALTTQGSFNRDLFLAGFDWLSEQEEVIAVASKPSRAQALPITQQDLYVNAFVTLLLVPALLAGLGVAVYVRRRQ